MYTFQKPLRENHICDTIFIKFDKQFRAVCEMLFKFKYDI